MKQTAFSLPALMIQLLNLLLLLGIGYLIYLLVKALRKYLKSAPVRKEKEQVRQSLGETIREQRKACKMTQEFVAESLGVSRQAVSKWESGASDPSTANLLALAKLFQVDAAKLLQGGKEARV